MKKTIKILSLLMAIVLMLSMAACTGNNNDDNFYEDEEPKDVAQLDTELEIKINLLNGTTALGMAKMIVDANNNADDMNYNIELFTSADGITGPIVSGECDIAALPTNVAAKLYKASAGKIQLLAVNTLGVLYLLQKEVTVTSFEDLKGKTIYLPGGASNPEYITAALLEANGLKVGEDVILDTTSYPSPDALQTALVSGIEGVELAVLPEPKVTVTQTKNDAITIAMDFTQEWEKVYGENTLAQGCLVVNAQFAKEHPQELSKFLDDYKASVEFISTGSEEAINTIVEAGILPQAPIAKKALPKCNICFIEGADMKTAISVFYEKLFAADNSSIVAIPDDNFYYKR